MRITSSQVFAALCGLSILAGCDPGESAPTEELLTAQTATPLTSGNGLPVGQSGERGGRSASPRLRPDAVALKTFAAKRAFEQPQVPTEVAVSTSSAMLAATGSVASCTIDYNQATVLNTLPNKAWNTFAYSPFYNQTCGGISQKFWLYTLPLSDNHYHLGYEDPLVCFDPSTPKRMGRYASAPTFQGPPTCQWATFPTCNYNSTDAATLRRRIFPHVPNEWIQIYAVNANTHARSTFNLKSLYIPPDPTASCYSGAGQIQLWVKTAADQQWWFWSWINPGGTFVPGPGDGDGLDEMQITAPGSYEWTIDDVKLDVLF